MEFRILKYFVVLSLALSLSSCSKKVKVNIPGFEEKVVIQGSIETDGFPFVLISKNKNVYSAVSQKEILGSYLSGAQVWVSDGTNTIQLTEVCTDNLPAGMDTVVAESIGIPVALLHEVSICAYVGTDPNFKGQVGKTYSLKVDFEGQTYTASSTILPPIPFASGSYWKEEPKIPNYGMGHYFLQDPPEKGNSYLFEVKRTNKDSLGKPIDSRYYKVYSSYYDDEFFNGKKFEMYFENTPSYDDKSFPDSLKGYFKRGDTLSMKLSNYEHNIYKFFDAVMVQQVAGGPFATPINAPGNISNGALGLWVAFSPSYSVLICK